MFPSMESPGGGGSGGGGPLLGDAIDTALTRKQTKKHKILFGTILIVCKSK